MWGVNEYGMLGQNNKTNYSSPKQVPGTTWSFISGGDGNMLALKTDNTLWSWGLNVKGLLGQNNTTYYSSPVQVPGTEWANMVSFGHGWSFVQNDQTP